MLAIEHLDNELKKIVPTCVGVSIGKWDKPETWRVDSFEQITPEQKQAVDLLFTSFDKQSFDAVQAPAKTIEERLAELEATVARLNLKK